ncbi:hypothetical protein CY652_07390 [Burkholderia sp. WAC0059]|uniref:hypothetical protein n=1 Tax=Burkholderia sp. WAC0059 TaxID=2066022 RepID=UPI000C7F1067|nr:hypothetical protein [Burkholderia sp. WAC0059]PLZ03121.1 hypothetical protein CY652_07390 [Burkholderia sp. WAC0059]
MRIIENGNFTPVFRIFLWLTGIVIVVASCKLLSDIIMFIGVVVGMLITATGTYAERANLLRLKPFGTNWKKVRKTYEKKDDDA